MTKFATIQYNEEDEQLLLTLFDKLNVTVSKSTGVPDRVAKEMQEGLKNIKAYERGEIELQDANHLLEELKMLV
jgi:hypothetical protein